MSTHLLQHLKTSSAAVAVALGLSSGLARAADFPEPYPTVASITSIVTQSGPATWQYQLTIHNDSESHDFGAYGPVPWVYWVMIPYFADAGVTNITCPGTCWNALSGQGWFWSTPSVNSVGGTPGFGNPNDLALSWEWPADTPVLGPGTSLSGFGFTASYAPVKGPFNLRFALGQAYFGDPAIPGSPLALAAGYVEPYPVTGVPEAGTYAMLLAGLAWLGVVARRRAVV